MDLASKIEVNHALTINPMSKCVRKISKERNALNRLFLILAALSLKQAGRGTWFNNLLCPI